MSCLHAQNHNSNNLGENISDGDGITRRTLFRSAALVGVASLVQPTVPAQAVGPVKIDIINPTYTAAPCPKDKPIPGEKAMKGMRGLCVQVKAELAENSPKELDKVGVYGYVNDAESAESVVSRELSLLPLVLISMYYINFTHHFPTASEQSRQWHRRWAICNDPINIHDR